jgi:hypothetical protein
MSWLFLAVGLALLVSGLGFGLQEEAAPSNLENLVREAKFIFKGTVQKLNATTMQDLKASDTTVTVKVDEVLTAPKGLDKFKGKEITVLLNKPQSVKEEQEVIFFTNTAVYGKSLAVQEVGHLDGKKDMEELKKQLSASQQKVRGRALQKNMDSAKLVVLGKVTEIKQPAQPVRRRPITEHDPNWQEAVIQIDKVDKGQLNAKTVTVLFPGSNDVMWARAPKFKKGDEGAWLLHENQIKGVTVQGYTALDADDYFSKEKWPEIQELMKSSR